METQNDPTKRFTNRVDNYVKYRPGYPDEAITGLQNKCKLTADAVIADVGSGTGIFSALLLRHGFKVYAVEPNEAMRGAAERSLGDDPNFISVNGTAEYTTLAPKSIDLVVCAQAFHWFDEEKTKVEFNRILSGDGHVALIWNNRLADADGFSIAYENLLKNDGIDYNKVNHRRINDINFKAFFKDGGYKTITFTNRQNFDLDGLMGRAYSSSYVPAEGTEAGEQFRPLLKKIFEDHQQNGQVSFHYRTEIYLGKV